jgi:hypothetical protein
MVKYLQLLKALLFFNHARKQWRTPMMSMRWELEKHVDFVGDHDEEDNMHLLVVEDFLLHVDNN